MLRLLVPVVFLFPFMLSEAIAKEAGECRPFHIQGLLTSESTFDRDCKALAGLSRAIQVNSWLDGKAIAGRLASLMKQAPFERLRKTRFDRLIHKEAIRAGVDPLLLKSLISVESNFDPMAVSVKGAAGLMQLMPATAKRFGTRDRFDPRENLRGGTRYLKMLLDRFAPHVEKSLAAYNAGENAVIRYGGIPPYRETQNYVQRVMGIYRRAQTR